MILKFKILSQKFEIIFSLKPKIGEKKNFENRREKKAKKILKKILKPRNENEKKRKETKALPHLFVLIVFVLIVFLLIFFSSSFCPLKWLNGRSLKIAEIILLSVDWKLEFSVFSFFFLDSSFGRLKIFCVKKTGWSKAGMTIENV